VKWSKFDGRSMYRATNTASRNCCVRIDKPMQRITLTCSKTTGEVRGGISQESREPGMISHILIVKLEYCHRFSHSFKSKTVRRGHRGKLEGSSRARRNFASKQIPQTHQPPIALRSRLIYCNNIQKKKESGGKRQTFGVTEDEELVEERERGAGVDKVSRVPQKQIQPARH